MLGREPRDQPLEQHRGTVQHLLGAVGPREQLEPALEHRREDDGLARVGAAAEGGVDLGEQAFAEAPRQAGARQAEQVAELAQAHALQCFPMLAAGAEQPHRHLVQCAAGGGKVGAMRRRLGAREHRRALRRGGARDAHRVAERLERIGQAHEQARQAAEVAQAGLHLEQHGVISFIAMAMRHRDLGRESERGMRHRQQGALVARGIGLPENDARRERQRGRAFQPRLDAERARRGIGGRDAMRIDERDRRGAGLALARHGERGRERLERERRQMQRDPDHGGKGNGRELGRCGSSTLRRG